MKRKQNCLAHKEISVKETDFITNLETPSQEEINFKCNLCDRTFQTINGLKMHKGKARKDSGSAPAEKLKDNTETPLPKLLSPKKGTFREEQCLCCGELMSPHHQCRHETPNIPSYLCGKDSEIKTDCYLHKESTDKGVQWFVSF